jgi:hypothetical protein
VARASLGLPGPAISAFKPWGARGQPIWVVTAHASN